MSKRAEDETTHSTGRRAAPWLALFLAVSGVLVLARMPLSSPPADSEVSAQAATATPQAIQLPGATRSCRVVGRLDEVAQEKGELRGRLQNVGARSATLGAFELGWSGDATLRRAVLQLASGGENVLFEGSVESPAFIVMEDAPVLAAGQVGEMILSFEVSNEAQPWLPGEVLVHMREDCHAVLAPAPETPCDLRWLDGPRPAPARPEMIEVVLRAEGGARATRSLDALEITWPTEVNGALVAIALEGQERIVLETPLAKSPATVPLDRWLRGGLSFEVGRRLTLGLVFEHAAAPGPYAITMSTSDGCAATASTWIAAPDCGLRAGAFEVEDGVARARLVSSSAFSRTVESLALFWPTGVNGALIELRADGRVAWSGKAERSPAALRLEPPIVLPARGGVELELRFAASGQEAGSGAGGLARGAYTMVAQLKGGCRAVFTARETLQPCRLSAGELRTGATARTLELELANSGTDARLGQLALRWNPANGVLRTIRVAGKELLDAPVAYSTRPLTLTLEADDAPLLSRNQSTVLQLGFETEARPEGTSLELGFLDLEGQPCQEILVSKPLSSRPTDCPYSLTGLRLQELDVLGTLSVAQEAEDAELVAMEIEWPEQERLRPLERVDLIAPDGSSRLLWRGPALSTPLAFDITDGVLKPGLSYTLRLRFAGRLEGIGDVQALFRVTLGFADGCRIVDRAATAPPPEQVLIEGVLQAPLPQPLLGCCWRVARSTRIPGSGEVVWVEADTHTVIEPDAVTPRIGDLVSIDALADTDGRYYAQRVRFIRHRRTERLAGAIQSLAPEVDPATGLARWVEVLGRRVHIEAETQVTGIPARGALALVEGERNPDGSLTAVTLRVAGDTAPREFVEIKGVVQRARSASDPTDPALLGTWSVGRYIVRIRQGTMITGSRVQPGQEPELPERGTPVRVYGATLPEAADGARITIDAEQVEILEPPEVRSAEGVVLKLPEGTLLGTWSMRTAQGEDVDFTVRSMSAIDQRLAPATVGAGLRVRLQETADEGWLALDVETDWGE